MVYKNGVQYSLIIDGCKVNFMLENFRPAVVEKFNQMLAQEKIREFKKGDHQVTG